MTPMASIDALRGPSGAFAMVALDQRESLRTMLEHARGGDPGPADVSAFKVEAARFLSPFASAVLLDIETGLGPASQAGALAPGCALIVAGDRICQPRGGVVSTTGLDRGPFDDPAVAGRADAFKLLVIWHPDRGTARRARLVRGFIDACRTVGRPAVVEGVVRRPPTIRPERWDHAAAVLAAAHELAAFGPDLYKAEVPTQGLGTPDEIAEASDRITAAVGCPWC